MKGSKFVPGRPAVETARELKKELRTCLTDCRIRVLTERWLNHGYHYNIHVELTPAAPIPEEDLPWIRAGILSVIHAYSPESRRVHPGEPMAYLLIRPPGT
jgi:hypothetical protein